MENVPWAKFSTRSTPKISDSPEAIRNRNIAAVRPLIDCAKTNDGSGRRSIHELRRIDVRHGLHDRERILRIHHGLAVELPAVRLVVLLADRLRPDRRLDRSPQ